jgi:osmotically-inducible protein OsmY
VTNEQLALSVSEELFWDPRITVTRSRCPQILASSGTVTPSGQVLSWPERDAAVAAAWAAPGVSSVDDRLTVSY